MIHPKIILRDYGPCFCTNDPEDLQVHGNLSPNPGGYIILGDYEKKKRNEFLENECERYLSHEILHSLLDQMKINDYGLDELRFKYKRKGKKWIWIFEEV